MLARKHSSANCFDNLHLYEKQAEAFEKKKTCFPVSKRIELSKPQYLVYIFKPSLSITNVCNT